MTFDQIAALSVLLAVVAALIWGKSRSDIVALCGAATLLLLGVVRPVEAQSAFASPALIALASLFVIAHALEISGVLGALIRGAVRFCERLGTLGLWLILILCGALSAFLNNTPIVVMAAPVVKDVSATLRVSPKRYLIPLSYMTILGGGCTLIGTSTNLLVNDMARNAGQPAFTLFEIAPVGLAIAAAGALFLLFFGARLLPSETSELEAGIHEGLRDSRRATDSVGDPLVFGDEHPTLDVRRGLAAVAIFLLVMFGATLGVAPIAALAFAGAVALILFGVITPDEAYRGLRPQILLLIAGMVVVGLALELSGLASTVARTLADLAKGGVPPILAMALLYGATLLLTEFLSNAAVAVLLTPIAVALGEALGVDARPFVVTVMMAGSAAFATPFGYQTNILAYELGGYSYMDFVRIGLPLNLITALVGIIVIPLCFPF
ncbi:MAG: SLC13 family permease [Hyphomonadaceae bacterium]